MRCNNGNKKIENYDASVNIFFQQHTLEMLFARGSFY